MSSIYKYQRHSEKLIEDLSKLNSNPSVKNFVDKYKTWFAYFEEVLLISERIISPKIHSLVATSKIVALCGMAEGFVETKEGNKEKFERFLNYLSPEEKLLFSLAFSAKKSIDKEAQILQDEYANTGDSSYFESLIELTTKSDDVYHKQVGEIMNCFINGDFDALNNFFKSKIELLYGIRSKIVHGGSPDVVGAMLVNNTDAIMFYGSRRDDFFTIRYPLEEFFIRAVFRAVGYKPAPLDPSEFLWDEFISGYAPQIARIANMVKQAKT